MLRLCLAIAAALLAGCATKAPVASGNPEQVVIHESVVSAPPRYEIVQRLWSESWSSSFRVPLYATQEDAMNDFRRRAASLGGNGIVNFGCYRRPGASGNGTKLNCNGTVVRFL
ncbi:MAG: hypothetical protein H7Y16_03985 [Candidatus Parcubacteria bacterium]|nr:hypothetical protein [Burkholderiales bacterium]